ncbi:MAG: hypothetical protein KF773_39460 [Deltaproteobacteria bacterium]|nr:hypothetical protein [Deltaproteobacteria bacterium]
MSKISAALLSGVTRTSRSGWGVRAGAATAGGRVSAGGVDSGSASAVAPTRKTSRPAKRDIAFLTVQTSGRFNEPKPGDAPARVWLRVHAGPQQVP